MKKINLKQSESSWSCVVSLLIAFFVLMTLPFSGFTQTPPTSIDNIYIERATQPSETDINATKVKPLQIMETKIVDGDVIVFDIPGINGYLSVNNNSIKNVILKINQVELPELPAFIESAESNIVRFRFLKQNLSNEEKVALYKLPGKSVKDAQLGIKIDQNNILYFNEPAHFYFKCIEYRSKISWITFILFSVFFLYLIYVKKDFITDNVQNLLDDDDDSENKKRSKRNKKRGPDTSFSFSKTQLAFWTFIILASFIYIWIMTGDLNTINATGLILLGITSATITASNLISKNEESRALLGDEIEKEKGSSNTTGIDPATNKKEGDTENRSANGKTPATTIDKQPKTNIQRLVDYRTHYPEDNFITDILSDSDGVSIHRLQALVFNLIFGVAFITAVFNNYSMPEFSETQLILLGLSSGTYAFIKHSETKKP